MIDDLRTAEYVTRTLGGVRGALRQFLAEPSTRLALVRFFNLKIMQKDLLELSVKVGKELEKSCEVLNLDDYQKDFIDESIITVFNNEISSKKKKIEEIETLLNELHNDMAKSIIDMKTYKPLSTDLLAIKDKIRLLND